MKNMKLKVDNEKDGKSLKNPKEKQNTNENN